MTAVRVAFVVEQIDHSSATVSWAAGDGPKQFQVMRLGESLTVVVDNPPTPASLEELLLHHQRVGEIGGCHCGGVRLGASYTDHLARQVRQFLTGRL